MKKGSREEYLKNEQALEEYAASLDGRRSGAGIRKTASCSSRATRSKELWRLVGRYSARALQACDKRWDSRIVEALIKAGELTPSSSIADEASLQALIVKVEEQLRKHFTEISELQAQVSTDGENGPVRAVIPARYMAERGAGRSSIKRCCRRQSLASCRACQSG